MSRLEELLQALCPDGVEFKQLGDAVDIITPPVKLNRSQYQDFGKYAIVDQGQTLVIGFTDSEKAILPKDNYVVFGDHTRTIKYIDFSFAQGADGLKILLPIGNLLSSKYLYYAISNLTIPSRGYNRHWGVAQELLIPIPPLPVQEEIVRILDTFSSTVAELEAERAARIRQYEHYRDNLLTFNETAGQLLTDKQVRWVTLGEIATKISTGGTPNTQNSSFYDGTIPWLRTQEVNWLDIYDTGIKITDEGFNDSSANWIPMNCVIVAMYGATAAKVAINKISLTTNQACCNIQVDETKALYRYVFYWLCKEYETLRAKGQGSQSNINSLIVKNHPIPLPSLEEQSRIVEILDRFDTLVNDLKTGLPAEIALRRKQYEHYRDTLLTFTQTN